MHLAGDRGKGKKEEARFLLRALLLPKQAATQHIQPEKVYKFLTLSPTKQLKTCKDIMDWIHWWIL